MRAYRGLPLHPTDIGLILSYRCLQTCAHCLYNCGPGWRDWMTVDQVSAAFENLSQAWGSGIQVHLTGGEPFLNFPLLLAATRIAVDMGFSVYVETNASWCRDLSMARARFKALRESGMDAVLISVSPFHQETIPLQRTLDGISAARAAFDHSRVIVYQSEWLPEMAQWGLDEPASLDQYPAAYGQKGAGLRLWLGYGLISGGRSGYRLGVLAAKRPAEAFINERCTAELLYAQHSHMDLYGHFIPAFCGGITLGDWHDLATLVGNFRTGKCSELIKILLYDGPYGLYLAASGVCGYMDLPGGYAGKCHLCVDVRRHLVKAGDYPDSLHPVSFYDSF